MLDEESSPVKTDLHWEINALAFSIAELTRRWPFQRTAIHKESHRFLMKDQKRWGSLHRESKTGGKM